MSHTTRNAEIAVTDEQTQMDELLSDIPEQARMLLKDVLTLADEVVALRYQRDMMNSELASKQSQLRQLYANIPHELIAHTGF